MSPRCASVVAAALLCVAAADPGAGLLARLVAPMPVNRFMAEHCQRRWGYFPHNETLVPIDLAQVSAWLGDGRADRAVEILRNPVTKKEFERNPRRKSTAEAVQDAFLQGFSVVINSLHHLSEPGLRLAFELYDLVDLPVDVYMYLTPPHSKSYGVHSDVMDAWMIQLAGSKTWRVCDVRNFEGGPVDEASLAGRCEEVTMRGGDAMYVPFATPHSAATSSELSAHLTVNVERQYYVWGALLVAFVLKAATPSLTVADFLALDAFGMEADGELQEALLSLMPSVPRLAMLPLSAAAPAEAARLLVRPLSGEDLPEGYAAGFLEEYQAVAAEVAEAIGVLPPELREATIHAGGVRLPMAGLGRLLAEAGSASAAEWVMEVCRLHALEHFGREAGERALPRPELFSSLAAARSERGVAIPQTAVAGAADISGLITAQSRLVRRTTARVVVLRQDAPGAPWLRVNGRTLKVAPADEAALHFSLGLFGPRSAQGRSFGASAVPGGFEASRRLLARLVTIGALRLLPPGDPPP